MSSCLTRVAVVVGLMFTVVGCDSTSSKTMKTSLGGSTALFEVDNDRFQDDQVSVTINDIPGTVYTLSFVNGDGPAIVVATGTVTDAGPLVLTDEQSQLAVGLPSDSLGGDESWSADWSLKRAWSSTFKATVTFHVDAVAQSGDWSETPDIKRVL